MLVGSSGVGPWQSQEIMAFLREFVERDCPVIRCCYRTVISRRFPGCYRAMTWVDLANDDALDRLVWGITGEKPWLTP